MCLGDKPPDQLYLGRFGALGPQPIKPDRPDRLTEFQGSPQATLRPHSGVGIGLAFPGLRSSVERIEIHTSI